MWVPNQINLLHSPVQRVPKWIWIPLHYLTWSIKYSPYIMHWKTLDSEDCSMSGEAVPANISISHGCPCGGGWVHSPHLSSDVIKGVSALAKRRDEGQRTIRDKSLKLFQYRLPEDWLPDPDLIQTHNQALLTAVTSQLGLQESRK